VAASDDAPTLVDRFVDIADGRVHVVECGAGRPVVLLHQTPRSWDEYRDVLPLLGLRFRALAIDQLGFGGSARPAWEPTVERYAGVVAAVLEELGIEEADVVGHHTGAVVALELAAARPELVGRLVLSSCPLADAEFRRARAGESPVDNDLSAQGLRAGRAPFYPDDRPDLLDRFVADALVAGEHAQLGHHAVHVYEMERRIGLVRAPALVVAAPDDPFAYPQARPLAAALADARVVDLERGTVPLPDQLPAEFAAAVSAFLEGDSSAARSSE
jgi:pimeloyl-ACP methyl ester carboxylesterase